MDDLDRTFNDTLARFRALAVELPIESVEYDADHKVTALTVEGKRYEVISGDEESPAPELYDPDAYRQMMAAENEPDAAPVPSFDPEDIPF